MKSRDGLEDLMAREFGFEKETLERELKANLKNALLGGYSKKSVFSYVERLKVTMEQMHSNMEQQVNDLVREKTELVHEATLLRQQLQETELRVRQNQEQVSELQQQCNQLRQDAEYKVSNSREKERVFMEIQEENDNFKKMEELLRVRMEEQDKLFEERRSLKIKLRSMEKETERLESELEERQKLCEAFEQQIIEAERIQPVVMESGKDPQIEELLMQLSRLEQEKQLLEDEVRANQSMMAEATAIREPELKTQEAALQNEMNRQIEAHQQDEVRWREEISRQTEVNRELKERLDQVQWQMEENRDAMEFQKGKFREMEAENKMLEQEKEMLRGQVYEATLRQREVDKENQRNEILTQKIHGIELEKEDLEERLIGMKGLLDEMKVDERNRLKDTEEERAAYERLQQKFNQLYQQSQELRLQLKQMEQERRASDTVLEKYQKQEKDYILLKQNNESYLGEIESLESSVRFMFEQMNQQADAFKNLTNCYEDGKRKIQELIQEKTNMQLRNVELIEQFNELNQYVNKIEAGSKTENKTYHTRRAELEEEVDWMAAEFGTVDTSGSVDEKTVNIGEIKKRSLEMTSDIKERLNKQMGGA